MSETKHSRVGSISMGLRAVIMLIAGLYALFFPGAALTVLVILAGAIFLADGVLGLWSITFGGAKTGNFWFDVVRNTLSILMGVLIFVSPLIATVVTTTVVIYVIALQAIIVGGMEIYLAIRERASYAAVWPILLSGIIYVLFGILLLIAPLAAAAFFVMLGGVLAVLFAVGLFGLAWQLYKKGF